MSYAKLVLDIQAYTEDNGDKFLAALPRIISNAMTVVSRALPLQMYESGYVFALRPNAERILFSEFEQPIDYITIDSLIMGTGEVVERRSPAYIQMHKGRGTPAYFCDIEGGIRITPIPFRSEAVTLNYQRRPPLDATHQTNWYTEHTYDLLLKACLMEAHEFLIEPAMVQTYQADFGTLVALCVRDHQDMLRTSIYQPIASSATTAPKE